MTALNLGIQESGNPETWHATQSKTYTFSESNSVLPKTLARSGLAGKNHPGPLLGPFQANFSMDRKMYAVWKFAYLPWWANGRYSPGLGPCKRQRVGKATALV